MRRFPESLAIDITGRCNQRCRYCCFFANPIEADAADLSTPEWLTFFTEAGRSGVMEIVLRGGEPLMREDLPILLRSIVANRMRFRLLTNGTLMTRPLAEAIADGGRCNEVRLSIDGNERIHDAARGAGTHAAAIRALALLQEAGLPVTVTAVVHRGNFRQLPETAGYLAGQLGIGRIIFSLVSPGTANDPSGLSRDEIAEAFDLLRRIAPEHRKSLLPHGLFGAMLKIDARLRGEGVEKPGECGSLLRRLFIRADGVFIPCPEAADTALGRINRDSLAEIWQHSPELNRMRSYTAAPAEFESCRDCRFRRGCRPLCPAFAGKCEPCDRPGCLRSLHPEKGTCEWQPNM